jgi:hypothetical protein
LKSPEMERIQAARRQKSAALLPWLALLTGGLAITFLVFSLLPSVTP